MKINNFIPDGHTFSKVLVNIAKPPKRLYFAGTLPTERWPTVAIVGTRKPTAYGKDVTYRLAGELAQKDIIIVSGLALGIDGLAHRAALDASGTTIAILGNGLPQVYPSSHRGLAEQIAASGGAIIGEYEPETPALPHHFLERNRLVSGLADAVIVTEAAARSGTMSTAAHALEQGKEVLIVPGNITSPMSSGCNALLRQGATPITSSQDVLEVIAPERLEPQATLTLGKTATETTILKLLQTGIRDGDELQRKSELNAGEFATTLTLLEIAGTVRSLGGNQWTLK